MWKRRKYVSFHQQTLKSTKKSQTSQSNTTKKRPQKPPTPARWRGRHTSEGWECLFTVRWIEAKTFAARPKALANLSAAAPPPGWITVPNKGPYFMYLYIYIYFFSIHIYNIYIYGFPIPRNLSKCFMSSWWWRLHRWWGSSKAYPPMNLQGPPEKKKMPFWKCAKIRQKTRKHALLGVLGGLLALHSQDFKRNLIIQQESEKAKFSTRMLHWFYIECSFSHWFLVGSQKKKHSFPRVGKNMRYPSDTAEKKICQPRNKPAKQGCSDSCSILCHLTVVVLSDHLFFVVTYRHHHINCEARVCYERTSIAKYAPDITSNEAFSAGNHVGMFPGVSDATSDSLLSLKLKSRINSTDWSGKMRTILSFSLAMIYKSLTGPLTCVDYHQQQIHQNSDIERFVQMRSYEYHTWKPKANPISTRPNHLPIRPTFVTILSLGRKLHRPVEKAHGKQAQSCRNKYQHVENFNNFGLNIIETVQTWNLWSIHIPLLKLCTCINQGFGRPWLGLVTFYMNKKRGLICFSLRDGCAKHQLDGPLPWNET